MKAKLTVQILMGLLLTSPTLAFDQKGTGTITFPMQSEPLFETLVTQMEDSGKIQKAKKCPICPKGPKSPRNGTINNEADVYKFLDQNTAAIVSDFKSGALKPEEFREGLEFYNSIAESYRSSIAGTEGAVYMDQYKDFMQTYRQGIGDYRAEFQ